MLIYLILAIGIAISIYCAFSEDSDRIIAFLAGSFLTILTSILFSFIFLAFPKEVDRVDYKEDLFSLKMEGAIEGRFYLGTGSLNGVRRYYYYLKDSEGFLRLYSEPYYDVRLKEQSGQPYIHYQIIEKRPSSLLVPSFVPSTFERTKTNMYIPEGSVITKFDPN
jgi:hypothetical protein